MTDTSVLSPKKPSRLGLYIVPGFILVLGIAVSIWWVADLTVGLRMKRA